MPIQAECPSCSARYKAPDLAAGKQIKCKKCGVRFQIPAFEDVYAFAPPESQSQLSDLDALAQGEAVAAPRPTATTAVDDEHAAAFALTGGRRSGQAFIEPVEENFTGVKAYLQYFAAVGRGALVIRNVGDAVTFIAFWLALGVSQSMQRVMGASLTGGASLCGSLIVAGWYMAFKMNLVQSAAAGEQELPRLSTEDGIWDGVVVPFFRMLVTYIFAGLPAVILLTILLVRMIGAVVAGTGPTGPAVVASPVPPTQAVVALVILMMVGLFVWPMMVLVVSCGSSVGALFRLDLISATILRSLPAYLLTVVAVYIAFGVEIAIAVRLWRAPETPEAAVDWMSVLVLPVLLVGLRMFFDVVAMRAIGSYYRCFKHKFAWSWG
jgi:hypothetical protein